MLHSNFQRILDFKVKILQDFVCFHFFHYFQNCPKYQQNTPRIFGFYSKTTKGFYLFPFLVISKIESVQKYQQNTPKHLKFESATSL